MHSLSGAGPPDAHPHLGPPVPRRPRLAPALPALRRGRPGPGRRVPHLAAVVLRRPPVAGPRDLRLPPRDGRRRLPRRTGPVGGRRRRDGLGAHACRRSSSRSPTAARTASPGSGSPTGTTRSTPTTAPVPAESVWSAMQFCRTVLDLAELCRHVGRDAEAAAIPGPPRRDGGHRQRHVVGRRVVHARVRRRRAADRRRERGAPPDQPEPADLVRHRRGRTRRSRRAGAAVRGGAPRDTVRDRAPVAAVRRSRRARAGHVDVPARRQGERRDLLPRQHLARSSPRPCSVEATRRIATTGASCRSPGPTPTASGPSPTSTRRTSAVPPTRSSAWPATHG